MYTINGKFLTRKVNGQIRVAVEIIKELDKLVKPGEVEIVAPVTKFTIEGLKNIPIIRIGKGNAHIWEQTVLYHYLKKNNRYGINFLNTHPFLKPDISYIHDVLFDAFPDLYNTRYGKFQKIYTDLMIKSAVKRANNIITVSNFSKKEIIKYYGKNIKKINVIYDGWQHMERISIDEKIFDKIDKITKGEYLLAASGITPQKNFKWIVDNAKINKNQNYVIIGDKEKSTQDEMIESENLLFVGRVTDGEMKALMHYCKAFIHPAIYEGFGMTPLEAVGSGCKKIVLANTSCLPEIYGKYAYYIDPDNSNVLIDDILNQYDINMTGLLEKYSWEDSAQRLYKIMFE